MRTQNASSNFSNTKSTRIIVIVVGIFFAALGIFFLAQPDATYETTTGTITDIIEDYNAGTESNDFHVIISYRAAGKRYDDAEYGLYNSGMKIGDTVEVLYNIEDPSQIQAPGYEIVPYIMLAIGAGLVIYGIILIKKKNEFEKKDSTFNPGL